MSEAMYYERPVLLEREKHRGWRVKTSSNYAFARGANSVHVAGVEFPEAMKEYAIVFTRGANKKISPVVMLGLRMRENLFVDAQGQWDASYIPAFVRRYPFVLAQLDDSNLGVCIDEAYAGFNDREGEALFDAQGGNTPFLANALEFLEKYQKEFHRTALFCQRLDEAGLLREMTAKVDLHDGHDITMTGLLVVDEPRLMALPDATVLSMFRSGELHLVAMHLASLSNMHRLVQRVAQNRASVQPAPLPG